MKQKKNYYYVLIALLCCGMAASSVGICLNAYGVFFTPLSNALGVGRGTVSLHATLSGLTTGFVSLLVVKLLHRVPLKRLILIGLILICSATICMSFATQIWMFNVLGIVRGIGCACYYLPVLTIILGNWFEKMRGTITGIVLSFSGVSGAVFSPLLTYFISLYGYKVTYLIAAAFICLLTLPSVFFCELTPEQVGMKAYGYAEVSHAVSDLQAANQPSAQKVQTYGILFFFFALLAAFSIAPTSLSQHMPGYAEFIGIGSSFGSLMLSTVMLANISFKFILGFMSDKIGSIPASVLTLTLTAIGILILYLCPTSHALLFVAAFLFGVSYAFTSVGLSLIVRDVYGNELYGKIYSVLSMIANVVSALTIVLIGYSYDIFSTYKPILAVSVALEILSILLLLGIRFTTKGKNKERENR